MAIFSLWFVCPQGLLIPQKREKKQSNGLWFFFSQIFLPSYVFKDGNPDMPVLWRHYAAPPELCLSARPSHGEFIWTNSSPGLLQLAISPTIALFASSNE
ncbi:hypothetical protein TNIN_235021 [Trichonephila inaurata madagascariensis]|uniref:Uncharacterized protein n=1 Tax=Trichonephila inaurata madagascariensis TaxID=2747483 RepID=A0A8X6ICQ7_9ARAC|nr:hypothetical protein TNIN_235021 [Trichonephila inaurata madagascariensis]